MKKTAHAYSPSRLLSVGEFQRHHSFTRWVSRDLFHPVSDFMRNIRLYPIYAEFSPQNEFRYLFWHPPEGCGFEVRSGRTLAQFEEYDHANIERGWVLLSLHINENELYSAVWVARDYLQTAKQVLANHGITPASQMLMT